MAGLAQLIASFMWIALCVIAFYRLKQWNKRFSDMYEELKHEIEGGFRDV